MRTLALVVALVSVVLVSAGGRGGGGAVVKAIANEVFTSPCDKRMEGYITGRFG